MNQTSTGEPNQCWYGPNHWSISPSPQAALRLTSKLHTFPEAARIAPKGSSWQVNVVGLSHRPLENQRQLRGVVTIIRRAHGKGWFPTRDWVHLCSLGKLGITSNSSLAKQISNMKLGWFINKHWWIWGSRAANPPGIWGHLTVVSSPLPKVPLINGCPEA